MILLAAGLPVHGKINLNFLLRHEKRAKIEWEVLETVERTEKCHTTSFQRKCDLFEMDFER